jgi:hypothetical protein
MIRKLSLVVLLSTALVGCGHIPAWHSVSTVPLDANGYEVIGPASGQSCLWTLLGLIPVSTSNDTHTAIAKAIKSKPGADALVNVTADTFAHFYLIVSKSCVKVNGIAVKSR